MRARHIRTVAGLLASAVCCIQLAGCSSVTRTTVDMGNRAVSGPSLSRTAEGRVYKVGFDPRLDPYEEARIYGPFLKYLEKRTGLRFELRFTKRGETMVENIGTGVVDFAFLGGVSFVRAAERYGAKSIARGLNAQGNDRYRAAIVVRPDSPIHTLAELRGKSFAFGNESSTQGHLIPAAMLLSAGIRLEDLSHWAYHDSHQAAADSAISGEFDAAGIQDTLAATLEKQGLIRVVEYSDEYPSSGVAAAPDVDGAAVAAVAKALIEFKPKGADAAGLYHWDRTEMVSGFKASDPHDYDAMAAGMRALGMLGGSTQ